MHPCRRSSAGAIYLCSMSAREHLFQIPIRVFVVDASGSAIVAMTAAASEAGAGGIRDVLDCSLLKPRSPERRLRLLPQTDHWRAASAAVAETRCEQKQMCVVTCQPRLPCAMDSAASGLCCIWRSGLHMLELTGVQYKFLFRCSWQRQRHIDLLLIVRV